MSVWGYFRRRSQRLRDGNSDQIRERHQIVLDAYSNVLAANPANPTTFYDLSLLPYPKQVILEAIAYTLTRSPPIEVVEVLHFAVRSLAYFQLDVGNKPLQMYGFDLSLIEIQFVNNVDELARFSTKYDEERANYTARFEAFQALAEEELRRIHERLTASTTQKRFTMPTSSAGRLKPPG